MKKYISFLLLALLMLPFATFAAPQGPKDIALPGETMVSVADIFAFITVALNWFFYILLVLAVIYILMVAMNYITSGGKDDKVKENGKRLAFILVGIIVALIAKGLVFVTCNLITGGQPCRF